MAIAVQQIRPVAHLPLVLGVLRRLEVASLIDDLIPPGACALDWAWGRSPGPGHHGWRSCAVQGRATARRAGHAGAAAVRVNPGLAP